MRKKILIIVLCIILGGFSGTILCFQVQKFHIKKQVKEKIEKGIDKEKLVLLKFTYNESKTKLRWEHSKEFEYKHQMYDIVDIEYKEDSIYYWCWHDKEETEINNQINHIAKNLLPNQNHTNQFKAKKNLSKNLYCESFIKKEVLLNTLDINLIYFHKIYSSQFYSPLTPPPKYNC